MTEDLKPAQMRPKDALLIWVGASTYIMQNECILNIGLKLKQGENQHSPKQVNNTTTSTIH